MNLSPTVAEGTETAPQIPPPRELRRYCGPSPVRLGGRFELRPHAMTELTAHLELPPGRGGPAAARQALQRLLPAWGFHDPGWLETAALVASELVANAILHAGGCLALELHAEVGRVTLSAADGSAAVPRRREPGPGEEGGRGLPLIEAFSKTWWVEHHVGGKRVKAELLPCPPVAHPGGPEPNRTTAERSGPSLEAE